MHASGGLFRFAYEEGALSAMAREAIVSFAQELKRKSFRLSIYRGFEEQHTPRFPGNGGAL